MTLTKQEVLEIARGVAREVKLIATGCRCGLAMWDAHGHTDNLESSVREKQWHELRPLPPVIEATLGVVEQECSVKMDKAIQALHDLRDAADKGDWDTAGRRFVELRTFIRQPVEDCAGKKEG